MFAASTDPSDAPAPTNVCISSTNTITRPSARSISFMIFFKRSSNSPRYFVPAKRNPKSKESNSFSFSDSGTSPFAIRIAKPSTIAVFPVPGSPINTGLFFVRRDKIWIIRMISLSRPITGSNLSLAAIRVRFRAYFVSILKSFIGPFPSCSL